MKRFFRAKAPKETPFLSPLSQQSSHPIFFSERLPSALAPIAFTIVGGLALVVVIASLLHTADIEAQAPVPQEPAATIAQTASVQPAPAALSAPPPPPAQEPAAVTEATISNEGMPVQAAPDPAATGSILSAIPTGNALLPSVEVAETEAEIAALESNQRTRGHDASDSSTEQTTIGTADNLRSATTTGHVNMRSGPSDEAEVLAVVPARTRIQAEADCNWCATVYEGRSGYVYKSFLSYE